MKRARGSFNSRRFKVCVIQLVVSCFFNFFSGHFYHVVFISGSRDHKMSVVTSDHNLVWLRTFFHHVT